MLGRMIVIIALGGALAACGKPGAQPATVPTAPPAPAAAPTPREAVLADAAALRDAICACREPTCLEGPSATYDQLASRHSADELEAATWDLAPIDATVAFCRDRVRMGSADPLAVEAIATFERAAESMCACKDKPCAERVNVELEAAMERYKDVKGTEAQARSLEPTMKRYMECSMRVVGVEPVDSNGKPSR
jgi:hypothetical protein